VSVFSAFNQLKFSSISSKHGVRKATLLKNKDNFDEKKPVTQTTSTRFGYAVLARIGVKVREPIYYICP